MANRDALREALERYDGLTWDRSEETYFDEAKRVVEAVRDYLAAHDDAPEGERLDARGEVWVCPASGKMWVFGRCTTASTTWRWPEDLKDDGTRLMPSEWFSGAHPYSPNQVETGRFVRIPNCTGDDR